MKEEVKDKVYTAFTVAVVLLILVGGLVKASPRYSQYRSLKKQVAEREAKIANCERKIAELNEMQRRFQSDDEFVESIARQNRRVYPGELVFVFEGQGRETK